MGYCLPVHLRQLESEAIEIIREVQAQSTHPVLLYSVGKDSTVLLHLTMKALGGRVPFPVLHIDTTWKFREMISFRKETARRLELDLIVYSNPEGVAQGLTPMTEPSSAYTRVMKTEALRHALDLHGFDAAIGGARRDEERSRAKERVFSFRDANQAWDPRRQRPELWRLYNARVRPGESMRVFPLSNWTEIDVWTYIRFEQLTVTSLYFAKPRPVVERAGTLIMVDDDRFPLRVGETPEMRKIRFRTLGCYPLTGAVLSEAETLDDVIEELRGSTFSERQGRLIDSDE